MKKKLIAILFTIMALGISAFCFTACGEDPLANVDKDIIKVYNLYVVQAEGQGNEPLTYEEWIESIKGEDGATPTIEINSDGYWVINGEKTEHKADLSIAEEHSVNFIVDGETVHTIETAGNELLTMPEDPTKAGYWFAGWFLDDETFEIPFERSTLVFERLERDVDVYAKWTQKGTLTLMYSKISSDEYEVIGIDADVEQNIKTIVIPATHNGLPVTGIRNEAFYGCSSLTSVTIGENITSIGDSAFENCSSLTEIIIPDSVYSIGAKAFRSCYSLTSVTIGDRVEFVGDFAFDWCDSLTSVTIGTHVRGIGDYAFSSCDSLTSITISNSVESIGDFAFEGCDALESVIIGDSIEYIGKYAFYGRLLTSITFSDTSTWYNTTDYGNWQNKTGGTEVDVTDISANVTNIGQGVYWYKV